MPLKPYSPAGAEGSISEWTAKGLGIECIKRDIPPSTSYTSHRVDTLEMARVQLFIGLQSTVQTIYVSSGATTAFHHCWECILPVRNAGREFDGKGMYATILCDGGVRIRVRVSGPMQTTAVTKGPSINHMKFIDRGYRLTEERLAALYDNRKDNLTIEEFDVLKEILYNWEAALSSTWDEIGSLHGRWLLRKVWTLRTTNPGSPTRYRYLATPTRLCLGVHFVWRPTPQVLVDQLRGAAKDIPGAHVVRWLGHIALFDFTVGHAPRKKNAADGLSREPAGPSDQKLQDLEGDVEAFIDAQFNLVEFDGDAAREEAQGYTDITQRADLASALARRHEPQTETLLRKRALRFMFHDGNLWLRPTKSQVDRMLVVIDGEKKAIITKTRETLGHRGIEV
ncbi:hypothetical protein DL765_001129 [Monosporascus sp. GIB2]|nr:hypothetical protein DL765_001129 [Monosporascus sp. GIB2]